MNFEKFNQLVESRLNYGEMETADVVSDYKNVGCGDAYRLYLQIQNDVVVDAKYTTTGCSFSIATLGILCELAKGKSFEAIDRLPKEQFETFIEGYPERRLNYIDTAMGAMRKAILDYKNGTGLKKEEVITKLRIAELLQANGNLRGAVLSKAMLENFNFAGLDLEGADFQNSFLKGCSFENSALRNANFKGCYLNDANLTGADLSGSDMRFAKLSGAKLDGANFTGAIYDIGTRIDDKYNYLFESMIKKGKDLYIQQQ